MAAISHISEPCSPKQESKKKKTLKQNYLTNTGAEKVPFASVTGSNTNLDYYYTKNQNEAQK